jgi:hypothetical protein
MKVTLKGLRVALDNLCLFTLAAISSGILVMFLGSDSRVYQQHVILIVIGLGIMFGAVGVTYFALAVVFWFITPPDKNAPLPFRAEEWARAHTASERKAQLTKLIITYVSLAALGTIALVAGIAASKISYNLTTLIVGSGLVAMFLCTELMRRFSARDIAHRRLLKAEKAARSQEA